MYYIIIPYRDNPIENREYHKNFFIENTVPLLKKCLNEVEIIFVIQDEKGPFNRGALINAAFKEINGNSEDIFITHDIDINPYIKTINKYYKSNINYGCIQGIYTSAWDTLGGIIKFKERDFKILNGFNNLFWGWGGEDNDLQNRANFANFWIQKNITNRPQDRDGWFKVFNHHREKKSVRGEFKHYLLNEYPRFSRTKVMKYIQTNGLSSIKYFINSDVKEENIRYMNITLPYNQDDINEYLKFLKNLN